MVSMVAMTEALAKLVHRGGVIKVGCKIQLSTNLRLKQMHSGISSDPHISGGEQVASRRKTSRSAYKQ
jgi:hypothetical protein